MHVAELQLTDFRSYPEVFLELDPGVTVIVGRNGRGKTNLVEAVRYLSTLSSHRVAADAPLVRAGSERAIARAKVVKGGRSLVVEVTIAPGKARKARIGKTQANPREVLGILRTVVFAPEDLALVKGDPAGRRALMDELTVAMRPALAGDLADYERVMRQRGTLLKTARAGKSDMGVLDVWSAKAAELGARIIVARREAVAALAPHVSRAYGMVAPGEGDAEIAYRTGVLTEERVAADAGVAKIAEALESWMTDVRASEIERGTNLVGPHRDELEITLGRLPARGYASHGESWSCALALRLGAYTLLSEDVDEDGEPVLILDDVFSELDGARRRALGEVAKAAGQVLVTAAVPADVPEGLADRLLVVEADATVRVEEPDFSGPVE